MVRALSVCAESGLEKIGVHARLIRVTLAQAAIGGVRIQGGGVDISL